MKIEKTTGCVFFNDNRDNADNGLSATRTELTLEALWIYGLRGAGKLRELRIENWKLTEKSYLCKTKNRGDGVSDDTTKRLFPIGLSDGGLSAFDCFFEWDREPSPIQTGLMPY